MDQPNFWVDFYKSYPILGDTYRAKFLTYTPTMFAIFLSVGIFFLLNRFLSEKKRKDFIFLMIYFLCLTLTFSKTILLLISIIILLFSLYFRPTNKFLKLISIVFFLGCFTIFNFLSHFSIFNKKEKVEIEGVQYLSDKAVFELGDYLIVKNSYLLLKESSLNALQHSPIVGVGLGRFDNYLEIQKEKSKYPEALRNYDPHSTYFGVLAELGVLGGLALIFIMIIIYQLVKREEEYFPFIGILLLFLCEGIVTDMMNVRHLWLVIGLLIYLRFRGKD